jgi:hypothetical protein
MAKQEDDPKARESAGRDDRDVEDIETEIDEALEDVDEDELDERLDGALEKADDADPDEVLIELDEDEDDEAAGQAEDNAGRQGRK